MVTKNAEYKRKYYAANKEKVLAQNKRWEDSHKDKRSAAFKKRRARNPEKYRARYRKWAQDNPDKALAHMRKWRKENPEKWRQYQQAREGKKRSLPATLTIDQWKAILAAYKNRCAYCGKPSDNLTQDHVIPLSKGGGYTAENIVPACGSCNSKKGNREPLKVVPIRLMI